MSPTPNELKKSLGQIEQGIEYRESLFSQFRQISYLFIPHPGSILAYLAHRPDDRSTTNDISIHPVLFDHQRYFALGNTSFSQQFPAEIRYFRNRPNTLSVNWIPTSQIPVETDYAKVLTFADFMQNPQKNVFYLYFWPQKFFDPDIDSRLLAQFIQGLKTAGGLT